MANEESSQNDRDQDHFQTSSSSTFWDEARKERVIRQDGTRLEFDELDKEVRDNVLNDEHVCGLIQSIDSEKLK